MKLFYDIQDKVKLSKASNRSTNIEMDYKDSRQLKKILLSKKFENELTEILSSIENLESNQRVRVMSGSPGLGKSTFALFLLNLLTKKNPRLIREITTKGSLKLQQKISHHLSSKKSRFLCLVLNGDYKNIEQSFIDKLHLEMTKHGFEKEFNKIYIKSSNINDIVKKWKNKYPKIHLEYEKLVNKHGYQTKSFESGFKNGNQKITTIFSQIYSILTGGASPNKEYNNTILTFKKCLEFLSTKHFQGIYVIYDEFGKYLENSIHTPSKLNMKFFQDFSEFCERSSHLQCHFMLITHMSVSQYACRLPQQIQQEWAKIEGRFQETSFYDKNTDYLLYISQVFESNIEQNDPQRFQVFLQYCKKFKRAMSHALTDQDRSLDHKFINNCTQCYPLHPLSLMFLAEISIKVAQNERTMYTFLTRFEDDSLVKFLASHHTKKLPILHPSHLYGYFRPLILRDTGIGGCFQIAVLVDDLIGHLKETDHIEKEVICIIAIGEVIKNWNKFPNTEIYIRAALSNDYTKHKISNTLESLFHRKIIYQNKYTNRIELMQGSSVDLSQEIKNLTSKKLTSQKLVSMIKTFTSLNYISPNRYNFKNYIQRFCRTEYLSVTELYSKKFQNNVNYQTEDGIIYYILPFTEDERLEAIEMVKKISISLVFFIIPDSFIECQSDIEELSAIYEIYNNKSIMQHGPLVRKELDRYKSTILNTIERMLDPLIGEFKLECDIFYPFKNQHHQINHFLEIRKYVGEIFDSEYHLHIPIKNEVLNKHKCSAIMTLARRNTIDMIQQNTAELNFGITDYGPSRSIVNALNQVSKLEWKSHTNRLLIPTDNHFNRMFNEYIKIISSHKHGSNFQSIIDQFISPPFGIRKGVLPLYIAVFDICLKNKVNHYFYNEYIPKPDGTHYELILKHPKSSVIKLTELKEVHLYFITLLSKTFKITSSESIQSVVIFFLRWKQSIPYYVGKSKNSSSELKDLILVIQRAKEPDIFIFESIPKTLGFLDITVKTKKSEIKKMVQKISYIIQEPKNIYQDLIERIISKVAIEFKKLILHIQELNQNYVNKNKNMIDYFHHLPVQVKNYRYSEVTQKLMHRILEYKESTTTYYFYETVADALTGVHPRHWHDHHESIFSKYIHLSMREVLNIIEMYDPNKSGTSYIAFMEEKKGLRSYIDLGNHLKKNSSCKIVKNKIIPSINTLSVKDKKSLIIDILSLINN